MNRFFRGMLVGLGVGLLVAPMRGEEMRTLLRERFEEFRGYLPQNEQLNQYTQQVSDRVSQTANNLKDYAQQAATTVRSSANNLGNIAQQASSDVKQTGKDVIDTTKQTGKSAQTREKSSTSNAPDTAPFPSAYPEYTNPETRPNR